MNQNDVPDNRKCPQDSKTSIFCREEVLREIKNDLHKSCQFHLPENVLRDILP